MFYYYNKGVGSFQSVIVTGILSEMQLLIWVYIPVIVPYFLSGSWVIIEAIIIPIPLLFIAGLLYLRFFPPIIETEEWWKTNENK